MQYVEHYHVIVMVYTVHILSVSLISLYLSFFSSPLMISISWSLYFFLKLFIHELFIFAFFRFPFFFVLTFTRVCYVSVLHIYNFFFSFSGAIFEQGTDEVQSAFKFAMLNHNLNVTSRRFELQAFVDVINTADAFKLSRLSKILRHCFTKKKTSHLHT